MLYSENVRPDRDGRARYFNNFLGQCTKCDILFYDPDNGLNVMSCHYGTKYSTKYLFWCELCHSYLRGHSIIFYQQFPRPRGGVDLFIETMANDLKKSIGIKEIYSFKSSHVVFFLLPQLRHKYVFEEQIEYLRGNWSSTLEIKKAGFNEIKKH